MILRFCACTFMPADDFAHEPPSPQQAAAAANTLAVTLAYSRCWMAYSLFLLVFVVLL